MKKHLEIGIELLPEKDGNKKVVIDFKVSGSRDISEAIANLGDKYLLKDISEYLGDEVYTQLMLMAGEMSRKENGNEKISGVV